ncbi:50S ribosomal protein L24 [Geminicoccaceae bacterium 1502E]|nr:50S ribosomal protein L24 [Geminicoccaceae bacterium 1502E]
MMAARIKKGDRVVVLAGRDKGKQGEVLKVLPSENRVVVQGVMMIKRHERPGPQSAGGIVTREAPIHVSNVAHVDPQDGKATRVGFKFLEDGRKVRVAKRSGEVLDR